MKNLKISPLHDGIMECEIVLSFPVTEDFPYHVQDVVEYLRDMGDYRLETHHIHIRKRNQEKGQVFKESYEPEPKKSFGQFLEQLILEKPLTDLEIEDLIDRSEESVRKIIRDTKRDESEREQGKEVLSWIQDVRDTWERKNSLHPNTVNGLMRIVSGTSSDNPDGWGWKTKGWGKRGDGVVPKDYRNKSK